MLDIVIFRWRNHRHGPFCWVRTFWCSRIYVGMYTYNQWEIIYTNRVTIFSVCFWHMIGILCLTNEFDTISGGCWCNSLSCWGKCPWYESDLHNLEHENCSCSHPQWSISLYLLDVYYQTSMNVHKQANLHASGSSLRLSDSLLWTQKEQPTVLHQIPIANSPFWNYPNYNWAFLLISKHPIDHWEGYVDH